MVSWLKNGIKTANIKLKNWQSLLKEVVIGFWNTETAKIISINKFLNQIYNLSNYLKENYQENTTLLKNIVDTNPNISSILILDKNGFIEDFYATTN